MNCDRLEVLIVFNGRLRLSCVFRACFVGACVAGWWSCAPVFLAPALFGLHVFCGCFVIAKANENANESANANA